MPKKIVVANWKMNPESLAEAKSIVREFREGCRAPRGVSVIMCPPALFLCPLVEQFGVRGALSVFGAQDVSQHKNGPHTGEISGEQLRASGVRYVIVGHSEQRAGGETDGVVSLKTAAALRAGMSVILCIGESSRDEHGQYLHAISDQLAGSIPSLQRRYLERLVIAYEPLWAIGEKALHAATPEDVFSTVLFMRKTLADRFGKEWALSVPILYGGSVDPDNAGPMMSHGGVSGLLVGRESLIPKVFSLIVRAVERAR